MSSLFALLLSGSSLGVLGLAAGYVRRSAAQASRRAGEAESRETAFCETARELFDASRRSSDAVLETLDARVRVLEAAFDALLVFVPRGDELACARASGARAEHFAAICLRRDDTQRLPARAALSGCRVEDAAGMLLPTDRRALAVPLYDRGTLQAVVYASTSRHAAIRNVDAIVRTVEFASAPYASALEREADRADATYDGLTGILTPRAFRRLLHESVARAKRSGRDALCLWFVDTDCFKSVNDRFGHRAGDGVLTAMAGILRAHAVPGIDETARNGGDEFCALIRNVSKTAAIERAAGFCEAVRAHDFGLPVRVTASVGVAAFPHDARSSSELLEAADAAMYHSKRQGRDRVAFALEPGAFAVFER